MTSTQSEIEVAYDISNDFFKLWLDTNMHYTSAVYTRPDESLEDAQENKARVLYDFAEVTPEKRVCDIGCGWGSMLDHVVRRGCKEAVGISLSTEQTAWANDRGHKNARFIVQDYHTYEPAEPFDALVSVEMIDHLCSPAQAREGMAVEIYRAYFNKLATWVKPGSC